jgi:hypothetical protein
MINTYLEEIRNSYLKRALACEQRAFRAYERAQHYSSLTANDYSEGPVRAANYHEGMAYKWTALAAYYYDKQRAREQR